MKIPFKLIICFIVFVLSFHLLINYQFSEIPFAHSLGQYLAIPIIILLVYYFSRLFKLILPLSIYILSMVFVTSTALFAYNSFSSISSNYILLSALTGDKHEAKGKILRKEINSYFNKTSLKAVRHFRNIESYEESRSVLDSNEGANALVWGNEEVLNVTFKDQNIKLLNNYENYIDYRGNLNLEIIDSIPILTIYFQPFDQTSKFLSKLFLVEYDSSKNTSEYEIDLRSLGGTWGNWNNYVHRGYPWWLLGNHYLNQFLSKKEIELGLLYCAFFSYFQAGSYVNITDNPELYSAIHNNLAVAYFLKSHHEKTEHAQKILISILKNSINSLNYSERYATKLISPNISKRNLRKLKKLFKYKEKLKAERIERIGS